LRCSHTKFSVFKATPHPSAQATPVTLFILDVFTVRLQAGVLEALTKKKKVPGGAVAKLEKVLIQLAPFNCAIFCAVGHERFFTPATEEAPILRGSDERKHCPEPSYYSGRRKDTRLQSKIFWQGTSIAF